MGPGTGTASCSIRNAKCFCPLCPPQLSRNPPACPALTQPCMTLFLAKMLREWGASPHCLQKALLQTNTASLGENSLSCAGKTFISQARSEVGCGNPHCSPGCVWGQLLCAQAIFSPTDSHSLGQAKIPPSSDAGALPGWKQAH